MATNEELGVVDALDECPHCGDDLYPDEICDCVQPGRIVTVYISVRTDSSDEAVRVVQDAIDSGNDLYNFPDIRTISVLDVTDPCQITEDDDIL